MRQHTPLSQDPTHLVEVAPGAYLPFPCDYLAHNFANDHNLPESAVKPAFKGFTQAKFICPKWLPQCGIKPADQAMEVVSMDKYSGSWCYFIGVMREGYTREWSVCTFRGEFVNPIEYEKKMRLKNATLANTLVFADFDDYQPIHIIPDYNTNRITLREAKRAYRQIQKLLHAGDGRMDWVEGYANQSNSSSLGLLAFGSGIDDEARRLNPENRYGFSNWLWKCAEALGYECTDQDQTSRCGDCDLAIDSGSSTPDYYCVTDGDIFCQACANNYPVDRIRQSNYGHLSWKPEIESFQDGMIELIFDCAYSIEYFCKAHLVSPNEYWMTGNRWSGAGKLYFELSNLKTDQYTSEDGSEVETAYRAQINWPIGFYRDYSEVPVANKFWEWVQKRMEAESEERESCQDGVQALNTIINPMNLPSPSKQGSDDLPLLYRLAKGDVKEGVLFQAELDLINSLLESWNLSRNCDQQLNRNTNPDDLSIDSINLQIEEIEEN